jgi:hypothetical protein
MCRPMTTKSPVVPHGTQVNPISYLVEHTSLSIPALATEWGVTTDAIYRYRRYEICPRHSVALRMAGTFGWSVGDVLTHWAEKVAA